MLSNFPRRWYHLSPRLKLQIAYQGAQIKIEVNQINDENKPGIILCLLSSNRPIYEILSPSRTDQRQAFENQFKGMSDEPFSYDDFEETREKLIIRINELLNNED